LIRAIEDWGQWRSEHRGIMVSKSLRCIFSLGVVVGILLSGACSANSQSKISSNNSSDRLKNSAAFATGVLYDQPVDPSGKLLLSAWLDPDGSDLDQYIWDNFTLPSDAVISEIQWFGVYDPLKFGAGGAVVDFQISIYPSIAAGTEPAVAGAPLVKYLAGGNAAETLAGTFGTAALYSYSFTLPSAFAATGGVKYWLQIEAFQHGSAPDWCLAPGFGGDGNHYQRGAGAGGDIFYRSAPGDAAFTLLGAVPDVPTPTNTSTNAPTDTPTQTPTDTPTSTPTDTPTNTPTDTPTNTPTDTPTDTPTSTSTSTPTGSPTDTPTPTPINTAVNIPASTPTDTPVPTPIPSTPGRVSGGGVIDPGKGGGELTFGFVVDFRQGDEAPRGNLTYQDHRMSLRLKAETFDRLFIEGNRVWFTGTGILSNGQIVTFTVQLETASRPGSPNTFIIFIPALNGYTAGGAITGGNITIH
jgi:hypothetical protein